MKRIVIIFLVLAQNAFGSIFDATLYGTVLCWYRAEDVAGTSGTAVSAWNDHSGNGFNLTQATSGFQPTVQTGVYNGFSSIRFDGSDDRVVYAGGAMGNCGAVIAIIGRIVETSANAVGGATFNGSAVRIITFFPDAVTIYSGDVSETWGSSVPTRVNGVSTYVFPAYPAFAVVAQSGTPASVGTLALGISTINDPFNGDILEIVFYTNTLSTANQDSAAASLIAKYSGAAPSSSPSNRFFLFPQ